MNTIEYATFRYDTVEVENGLNIRYAYHTRIIRVSCQYAYQIYAYHTKIGNTRMYTSYEHAYVFHIYERAIRTTGTRIINEHLKNTNIVWV